MLLRQPQAAGGAGPQIGGELAVARGQGDDDRPSRDAHDRVDDRLGAESVVLAGLEPEDVARQVEGADLPATVLEDFVGADRAGHHLVEIFCRLCLAVDFHIAVEPHRRAEQLRMRGKRARLQPTLATTRDGAERDVRR